MAASVVGSFGDSIKMVADVVGVRSVPGVPLLSWGALSAILWFGSWGLVSAGSDFLLSDFFSVSVGSSFEAFRLFSLWFFSVIISFSSIEKTQLSSSDDSEFVSLVGDVCCLRLIGVPCGLGACFFSRFSIEGEPCGNVGGFFGVRCPGIGSPVDSINYGVYACGVSKSDGE